MRVHGGQNVGGIVGYISSGYTAGKRVIQNCANYGDISSTGNDAGGIVGNVSGAVTIQNCYNHGTISSGNWRAGGIVSFLSSSYGKVLNCYTIGKATAKKGDFAQVVGKKNSGTITNCYYLSTLGTDSNATAVTETELKAVPKGLGDAFVAAPKGLNDGYPVLRWQIPTYAVTFTVAPADAVASLSNYLARHGWKKDMSIPEQIKVLRRYNNLAVYANTILALAEKIREIPGRPTVNRPLPQPPTMISEN